MKTTQVQAVLDEAQTWLLTPFHDHGRVKGAGVDCAMFIIEVFTRAGLIPGHAPGFYPPDWHLHRSEERFLQQVLLFADEVERPLPGDLALFQYGRCFSHGSIVMDWPRLIHSHAPHGVRYGNALHDDLAGRNVRFFTLKEQYCDAA